MQQDNNFNRPLRRRDGSCQTNANFPQGGRACQGSRQNPGQGQGLGRGLGRGLGQGRGMGRGMGVNSNFTQGRGMGNSQNAIQGFGNGQRRNFFGRMCNNIRGLFSRNRFRGNMNQNNYSNKPISQNPQAK